MNISRVYYTYTRYMYRTSVVHSLAVIRAPWPTPDVGGSGVMQK